MKTKLLICALLAGLGNLAPAHAIDSISDLYTGPREQAMGGAYVAVVQDEEGIFLNPASMAGVQKLTLTYLDLNIEGSTDVYTEASDLAAFNNFNATSVNSLMGKDIYGHARVTPSLLIPNFGISLMSDGQFALMPKNQAAPDVTLGYQTTNGVQAAWGTTISPGGRRSKGKSELRLGIGAKVMWRRGGYYDIPLPAIMDANENTIKNLIGGYGIGYGVDAGAQFIQHLTPQFSLLAGSAWTNIGNMAFSSAQAAPVPQNLSFGLGAIYDFTRLFKVTVAYDYQHVTQDVDPRKREHMGLAFDFPIVSVFGGLSETFPTYGASVDLWLLRVTALCYQEEMDTLVGQDPERRYQLDLSFKF